MGAEIVVLTVLIFLVLAAISSGLNVALMSLNLADLKRKAKLGNKKAISVLPLRKNAHLSLAAILFSNLGFASATAIVLGNHLNGFVAGIISTLLLVIFSELLPQAIFIRRALDFCAIFSPFLKLVIFITYPISKPLQLAIDKLFGDGSSEVHLHSRHELGLMINEHLGNNKASELDEDEVEIIRNALQLSEKQVGGIMIPIKKVFYIKYGDIIDNKKIDEIKKYNWSRIPVFNKTLSTCYGIILMKDLVDIDFDQRPRHLDELILHPTKVVGSKMALDTLFRRINVVHANLLPVEKNGKIVGIVTLEDLIEEIIGHEIRDESDRLLGRK